ncbi:MAG: homoserine O-acetyltransferase [Gammaproteobacteria bacterium]|nr:MAG: homoserine O-acetyltransferase [Gammaproteobacteria bacterium]
MPSATRFLHIDEPLSFKKGGILPSYALAYETWGVLNADASNAVLILTGLSPSAHAASSPADPSPGWWEPMVGTGKPIDSDHFYIITLNSLGSCKGSTGPASKNPATGRAFRLDFPDLSIEDIASSAHQLIQHLGIRQLCTIVGPSMGGMSALAYLHQNPKGTRHFLTISGAPNAEPFSIAIRSLQRELIVSDPAWNDGNYDDVNWPENGMRMARKLGMLSYRSAAEWRTRFGRRVQDYFPTELYGMNYEVESYLEAAARRFVRSFDPSSYLYLSRSMDWFNVADGYPDLSTALAGIELRSAYVIGVETDILFPVHQQRAIADALTGNGIRTDFAELASLMGHDAFLVDYDLFIPIVDRYFKQIWKDGSPTGA